MKNRSILCLLSNWLYILKLIIGIIIIAVNSDIAGVIYDKVKFIISDENKFLLKSFRASLKGCKIPVNPTLLGPFRI